MAVRTANKTLNRLRDRLAPFAQAPTAVGLVLIVAVWFIALTHIDDERAAAERAAIQNSANLAGAFEEHLSRSLNEIDRSIKIIRSAYVSDPAGFDFKQWLKTSPLFDDQTLQVSIISRDGFIKLSSIDSPTSVGTDLRDREHFKFQAGSTTDELFISKPVIGRTTGKSSIQLTRRISAPDGAFDGMIVVSLDPAYLARFYGSVDLGSDGYVRVIGRDGIIRAMGGGKSSPLGKDLSGADLFRNFTETTQRGWYYTKSNFSDLIPRLVSFRAVKNYPLIITVGLASRDIFAGVEAKRRTYFVIALTLTGLIITVVLISARGRMTRTRLATERDMQNRRFDAVLSNMPLGVCMIDGAGQVALSNERFRTMYAIPEVLLAQGAKFRDLVRYRADVGTFAGDPEEFCDEITDKLSQGEPVKALTQLQNGRYFHVLRQPMEGGGWVSIHEDATEQHLSKEALEQTKRFLDTIIESVPIPIVVKDAKSHTFVLVNKAFEAFFGLPRDRLINRTVFEIYTANDAQRIAKWDQAAISSGESQVNADFDITTLGSGLRSVNTTRLVVTDAKGAAQYVIAVIEDITEKKRAHAEIAHMAHHDPLTDLPNRGMLSERLDQALANLDGDAKLGVLFLDLDHFKTVNDTLGHLVGDELLREVATRLRSCVRESDTVARLGGDEFAIIQVSVKEGTDTAGLAERVRAALTAPYDLGGLRAVIDVSIGIAHAPTDGKVSDDLMKRADLALYKAKADGRGRYRFFEPEMDARIKARRVVETDLRNALVNGEFELWYQPVVKIATGQVEGLEALLRWKHPTRGVVSPSEFISVAEETGLIIPLGEWVIRQACEEAVLWPANVRIAVNLSPVQFSAPDLVNVVVHALATSRIKASRLELEITEAMLLGNSQSNLAALAQLRSLGVQIVMDDFGTGYSSLNYLRSFHFDKIKIDGAFVRDLSTGNELSLAIVQTVAHLAGVLKVPTTAEGVETDEQLALVTAAGCTHFQGHLFSPPRPANEIHSLLRPRRSKSFAA